MRRKVVGALLVLLGLLAVSGLGLWLYLTSDVGAERVRAAALDAASKALAGRLEAQTLHLHGGVVVLEHVKLYTPEGELVAELDRAELDVALLALARRD